MGKLRSTSLRCAGKWRSARNLAAMGSYFSPIAQARIWSMAAEMRDIGAISSFFSGSSFLSVILLVRTFLRKKLVASYLRDAGSVKSSTYPSDL
mmetsp:Transcript_30085/g.51723  ORF Transcript_30085/g.51723 Transcript_30085/m.51723 type:complete len:94 (-) Transcript_30085:235-516(-)